MLVLSSSMFLKNKWLALEATLLENYFLPFPGFAIISSKANVFSDRKQTQ